jgi:hypothetical protein
VTKDGLKTIAQFNIRGDGLVVADIIGSPLVVHQAAVTNLLLLELLKEIKAMGKSW